MRAHDDIVRSIWLGAHGMGLAADMEVHLGRAGYADVLVGEPRFDPAFPQWPYLAVPGFVIEVKRSLAATWSTTHAVSQVRRYLRALRERHTNAPMEAWVVADDAQPCVMRGVRVATVADLSEHLLRFTTLIEAAS